MRGQAAALDAAMRAVFDGFAALRETMFELNRLGATPQINLIDVACKRALLAASMGSRLQLEHLAPAERHSVAELADRWAEGIASFAEPRLGAPKTEPKLAEVA